MANLTNLDAPISPHIDHELPATQIVWGKFGGLSKFCKLVGKPTSTVQTWLYGGHIPHRYYAHILAVAKSNGIALVPGDFLDQRL